MVKLNVLGFKSENEYLKYFFKTLLTTNRTYSYFVDWKKVKKNVINLVTEISILNALTKVNPEDREKKLVEIFSKYPEVIPVLPLIIAIREKNIVVLDIGDQLLYKTFKFNKRLTESEINDIVDFCKKSGIMNLFGEINDLYTYLLGMEVGLDSNARKNRSGKIFEQLVGLLLKKKIREIDGLTLIEEDSSFKIQRKKRADFVIYKNHKPKVVLECNFYASTGSKPIEVAHSYVDLQHKCNEENLILVWVTDGQGWPLMKKTIEDTFNEIDYAMNYQILDEKFDSIIKII